MSEKQIDPVIPTFDIKKYVLYHQQIQEQYKQKKISTERYCKLSGYYNEHRQLRMKVEALQKWIAENNLPFTVEYTTFNIQVLMETNSYLISKL